MKYSGKKNRKGMVLILVFIVITVLTAVVAAYIYLTSAQLRGSGYAEASQKALWLAEAGVQKAIWYLRTPTASGGLGENGTTSGITESLAGGTYTIVIESWNFSLSTHGTVASCSSYSGSNVAANAIDGYNYSFWQPGSTPTSSNPQTLTLQFPYSISINNAYFYAGGSPTAYTIDVSSDGSTWTTVATTTNSTNKFTIKTGVRYLRLRATATTSTVYIGEFYCLGSKITSTGTFGGVSRKITRTVVTKSSTQTGYGAAEPDWAEIQSGYGLPND